MATSQGPWAREHPREPRSVVKISGPADILGVLPHRLGFHPAESLVVVCLEGPRNRDRLVMRFDLPAEEHDGVLVDMVEQRIRAIKATGALLVVYTERADDRSGRLPREALVERLTTRLVKRRIGVFEALVVHRGLWHSYHCADGRCCPSEGTPIAPEPTPAAARYAAEAVLLGNSVLPTREALGRSFAPSDHAVAVAAREQGAEAAGQRLMTVADVLGTAGARDLVLATLLRLLEAWSDGDTAVEQEDASLVAVGLHDKVTRDEVMTFVLDHDGPLLVAVFSEIARRAAVADTAPICTVLAWAAYADGSGALASLAAERALQCEPAYAMAELVLDGLSRMVPPDAVRAICRQVRADLEGGGSGAALGSTG
jgi:hypothetical protein